MKKVILIMLVALFITGFTAGAQTKNKITTLQTDTLAKDEIYTCTMDQDVMSDHPGKCPKCGMTLVKQKMTTAQKKVLKEATHVKPAK
jgi:Cu(I)/Ag(I) efflux system membrane fusion protein